MPFGLVFSFLPSDAFDPDLQRFLPGPAVEEQKLTGYENPMQFETT